MPHSGDLWLQIGPGRNEDVPDFLPMDGIGTGVIFIPQYRRQVAYETILVDIGVL